MAAGDYYSCDVCGGKAFYDANLSYDFDNEQPRVEYGCGMKLGYVGDMACICDDCAKTHKVEVVATSSKASTDDGEPDMLWDAEDSENCYGDGPEDFANNYASNCMIGGDECEVDVLCAYRGSNRTMKITLRKNEQDEELEKPVSWSWVDVRPVVGMVAAPTVGAIAWAVLAEGGHIRYWSYERSQVAKFADSIGGATITPIIGAAPDMSVRDAAWTVTHGGKSVEADTFSGAMTAARSLRSEDEKVAAALNLKKGIEAEMAEHDAEQAAHDAKIRDEALQEAEKQFHPALRWMISEGDALGRIRALRSAPIGADQGVKS